MAVLSISHGRHTAQTLTLVCVLSDIFPHYRTLTTDSSGKLENQLLINPAKPVDMFFLHNSKKPG